MGIRYRAAVNGYHHMITKEWFPHILQQVRIASCTRENVIAGWAKSGLVPFNPIKILIDIKKPEKIYVDFYRPHFLPLVVSIAWSVID